MSTFKKVWDDVKADPGAFSHAELVDVAGMATSEEMLEVLEQAVQWAALSRRIPGHKEVVRGWQWFLNRAFNRFCAEARSGVRYATVLQALQLAERARDILMPGAPSAIVMQLEELERASQPKKRKRKRL